MQVDSGLCIASSSYGPPEMHIHRRQHDAIEAGDCGESGPFRVQTASKCAELKSLACVVSRAIGPVCGGTLGPHVTLET
jgi:hypothetical protein